MMRSMVLGLCLFIAPWAMAGEFNEVLSIGDAVPRWKDLPGTDDKKHSLDDYKARKFLVVIFTCNSCPIAADYEDRIVALANKYKEVGFVAINSNKIAEDSLEKMAERSQAKKFPFPYLKDETQSVAKSYGANFTPEFFVLDADRKVVYMGGLDDSSDETKVKEKYLESALESLQAGKQPAVRETLARGCRIRFVRERKKN